MNDAHPRKCIAWLAMSLDGYIADADDGMGWLEAVAGEGDNGYSAFLATVDTLLMGRNTHEWIRRHADAWPYPGKTAYVFSRRAALDDADVRFIRDDPAAFTHALKNGAGGHVWVVGGGKLISHLLQHGALDELHLTIAPVILGQGTALFTDIAAPHTLHLMATKRHGQFAELVYRITP